MLEVAESMSTLGTGVTGGEPLIVLDRVVEYCSRETCPENGLSIGIEVPALLWLDHLIPILPLLDLLNINSYSYTSIKERRCLGRKRRSYRQNWRYSH